MGYRRMSELTASWLSSTFQTDREQRVPHFHPYDPAKRQVLHETIFNVRQQTRLGDHGYSSRRPVLHVPLSMNSSGLVSRVTC